MNSSSSSKDKDKDKDKDELLRQYRDILFCAMSALAHCVGFMKVTGDATYPERELKRIQEFLEKNANLGGEGEDNRQW